MSDFLLTVIMPFYNDEKSIGRALDSVLASQANVRIIIIDDGSNSPFARSDYLDDNQVNVRVIRQKNKGLGSARMAGALAADTKYITFLDADDEVDPSRFSEQMKCALTIKHDAIVFCGTNIYNANGDFIKSRCSNGEFSDKTSDIINGVDIPSGASIMIERDLYLDLHKDMPKIRRSSETLFMFRVLSQGCKVYCINKPLYIQHTNPNSNSKITTYRLESLKELYSAINLEIYSSRNYDAVKKFINWKIISQIKSAVVWDSSYRLGLLKILSNLKYTTLKTKFMMMFLFFLCILPIKIKRK
jgi:glycosyltransferase involved in cell wall biosynthesis